MSYSIKDIVQNELCTGCGVCISESKNGFMDWNEFGFLVPDLSTQFNENAIKVCPFNPSPDDVIKDEDKLAKIFLDDSLKKDLKIGNYYDSFVGYSKEYRETSSSGGIATYVFEQLLEKRIVDHLYIVKEVNGKYEYKLFSDVKDIKKISKTRYIPVTLADLFVEIDTIQGKVALSGVACFIKAVRLKQFYNPMLKEKIPFVIGIICGGLKSSFFTDYLAQAAGIKGGYYNQEYRLKDNNIEASDYSFGAYESGINKEFYSVKMKSLGDMWGSGLFKSNACDFCTDVTTELADISLGDAWLEPYTKEGMGNSVIICRTKLALDIIKEGILKSSLNVAVLSYDLLVKTQQGSFNHRQKGLKYRIYLNNKEKRLTPYVRSRCLEKISWDFKIVQKRRRITRYNSFIEWKQTKNVKLFTERMKNSRESLDKATVFYHRLRRIRRMFNI